MNNKLRNFFKNAFCLADLTGAAFKSSPEILFKEKNQQALKVFLEKINEFNTYDSNDYAAFLVPAISKKDLLDTPDTWLNLCAVFSAAYEMHENAELDAAAIDQNLLLKVAQFSVWYNKQDPELDPIFNSLLPQLNLHDDFRKYIELANLVKQAHKDGQASFRFFYNKKTKQGENWQFDPQTDRGPYIELTQMNAQNLPKLNC